MILVLKMTKKYHITWYWCLLLLGGDEWCQWGGRTCHPFPPSTWTATLQSPHPHFRPTPGSHASTTAISKKTTVMFVTDAALFALSMEDAFAILRTINRTLIAHNVDSNLNLDLILETYQSDYFLFCDHLYSIFQCLMFCFWEIIIDLHNWNKKKMSKYKGKHGGKKGQKIRAWVDPPPSFGQCPKEKVFFHWGLP